MRFCKKCGDKIDEGEKFCNKCGERIEEVKEIKNKFCNKCGDEVEEGEKFCNKCGNSLTNDTISIENNENINSNNSMNNKHFNFLNDMTSTQKSIFMGIVIGLVIVLSLALVIIKNNSNYYFEGDSGEKKPDSKDIIKTGNSTGTTKKGKYRSSIIYDNVYYGVTLKNEKEAYNLIEEDSVKQKSQCPQEIIKIEDEIIKKFGIKAVNLCELDLDFSKELINVLNVLYEEYPVARGTITNLSLANATVTNDYIAAFMPSLPFAAADADLTFPVGTKTLIVLNTTYFLNLDRLDLSVKGSSNAGHFPKNATIYSPVAHEFGHYLSFLSLLKKYDTKKLLIVNEENSNNYYDVMKDFSSGEHSLEIINEGFENYKKDTGKDMPLDEWRGTISKYALAKDNDGEYIYDETIAEAFHDVYLNKDNAVDASKYVVAALKRNLGVK